MSVFDNIEDIEERAIKDSKLYDDVVARKKSYDQIMMESISAAHPQIKAPLKTLQNSCFGSCASNPYRSWSIIPPSHI